MIFLRIEPQPAPDEAAAIEAAIKELIARHATAGGKRLSYRDVAARVEAFRRDVKSRHHINWRDVKSRHHINWRDVKSRHHISWSDVARLEALDPGV